MLLPQMSRTIQIIVRSMITPNQAMSMKGTPNIYPRHEMGVIERAEPRLLHVVKA